MQSFGITDNNLVEGWRRASHVMSISTLLRGSPYHLQHDKCYFPLDICKKNGLAPIDACDVKSEAVKKVVKEIADSALSTYEEARALWKVGCNGENKQYKTMFLLSTPGVFYLEKLRKKGYNLLDASLTSPFMNVQLQNRLLIQKQFGRL